MKLTEADYFLPQVLALSGDRVLTSGTTQPMLIRGYVLKPVKSLTMLLNL